MFRYDPQRPYITCERDQEIYEYGRKQEDTIDDDIKLNYSRLREQNKHFIMRDDKLTFEEEATWICNDDLPFIANEGVYYLMTFISLGALAVEFNENIDFIKVELRYIFENKFLEKMTARINSGSYIEMRRDCEKIKQYFLL